MWSSYFIGKKAGPRKKSRWICTFFFKIGRMAWVQSPWNKKTHGFFFGTCLKPMFETPCPHAEEQKTSEKNISCSSPTSASRHCTFGPMVVLTQLMEDQKKAQGGLRLMRALRRGNPSTSSHCQVLACFLMYSGNSLSKRPYVECGSTAKQGMRISATWFCDDS